MSRIVRISLRARSDVEQVFSWLSRRSPRGAQFWYAAFEQAIIKIGEHPEQFAIVPEATSRWNRRVYQAFFKTQRGRLYRIIFTWSDTEAIVLRVRGPGQPPIRSRDLPKD